jgi:hypothetical protein
VRTLKISEYEGEDIDNIVRTVNTAVSLLEHSSNADQNYITHDFCRDLLRLFQSSTVPDFNQTFVDLERRCQVEADSSGLAVVKWPSIDSITQLALATYYCLSASGQWAKGTRPAGLTVVPFDWHPGACFNCGAMDHLLKDCPKPRNDAIIEANLQAMKDYKKLHQTKDKSSDRPPGRGGGHGRGRDRGRGRGRGRGGDSSRPRHKLTKDGKPLRLNPQGNYVLDQHKWHLMQNEQAVERLTTLLSQSGGPAGDTSDSPPPPPAAPSAAAASTAQADRIREALQGCFS